MHATHFPCSSSGSNGYYRGHAVQSQLRGDACALSSVEQRTSGRCSFGEKYNSQPVETTTCTTGPSRHRLGGLTTRSSRRSGQEAVGGMSIDGSESPRWKLRPWRWGTHALESKRSDRFVGVDPPPFLSPSQNEMKCACHVMPASLDAREGEVIGTPRLGQSEGFYQIERQLLGNCIQTGG